MNQYIDPATASVLRVVGLGSTPQMVKDASGRLLGWFLHNSASAVRVVKFYDSKDAPLVGSSTPLLTIPMPKNQAANVWFAGIKFTNGLWVAGTVGIPDADVEAPGTTDLTVNVLWQ
jgi:hypothetical protein